MSKKKKAILLAVVIVVIVALCLLMSGRSQHMSATPAGSSVAAREESYQTYLDAMGYADELTDATISLDVTAWTVQDGMVAENGQDGVLTGEEGRIDWTFTVEQEGFYNLHVGYIALPGTTSDIQRQVLLDGQAAYEAMTQIVFKRIWTDEEIRLKNENEIRPNATEVYQEQAVWLEDYNRRSGAPLIFYLSAGEHTLSFVSVKEPMEITELTFGAAEKAAPYAEVLASWQQLGAVYQGEPVICQAERREGGTVDILKSSPSITIQKNYSDSALVPYHPWHILYSTIGADNWAQPGDEITWCINAPEDGLYVLSFKGRQASRGVTSYRRLKVNGEVPFAEAEVLAFQYAGSMQHYTVAQEDGTPYYIYLHKGENQISLEVVLGSVGGVVSQVEESLQTLNNLYLRTVQLTGQTPSQFIDYEVAKKIPDFVETMTAESERLFAMVDEMVAITGEKGENTALLEKMAIEAQKLARDPEEIVGELSQLKNNISALGTWMVNVSTMPLELDSLSISAGAETLPSPQENWFDGIVMGFRRFIATFFHSTSSVVSDDTGKTRTITVWMASAGREQAQMIQNMIDETFSPNTDISVKLQLIPTDVVLRAALAGNGPDVVIGLSQATSQDFAMRGATVELSQMEGFEECVSRYPEGVLRACEYQDGTWGLPEQVTFQMVFYRKDILDELGLSVPSTWTELMEMIPVLSRENYACYMPSTRVGTGLNVYSSMVYQNDGDIYLGEGNDYGVASALYSDEAMEAFKWYTDLFTVHGLDVQADFANRFRTGEMPIGVTDYTTFCTLEIFAPEIKGLWSFAPFLGTEKEDGTIDNTYVCDTVQSVIMKGADDKEASWEFIKWWNSTETQLSYANTLEAIMGTAARYPAADPNVIRQLPWSNEELRQLLSQFDHLWSMPAVPGYYMNTRMIGYAFEDVVADLSNPRETLYLNIRDIDNELTKKREEFGLSTKDTWNGAGKE